MIDTKRNREEQAVWALKDLKADEMYAGESLGDSLWLFLLSGRLEMTTAYGGKQKLEEGLMFLLPAGDNFQMKAQADSCLMQCTMDWNIATCNRLFLEQLQQAGAGAGGGGVVLIPIRKPFYYELQSAEECLRSGFASFTYQLMKRDILLTEAKDLYRKEELAALFAPLLGADSNFKCEVMRLYPQVKTAKELMGKLNMSSTVFKRKFQESFGTSAHQWLIEKKKEKIFQDIVAGQATIAELADKYMFTVNYMTTFCREHFGKSPTQLRAAWKEGDSGPLQADE